jgi:Rieske Fe-S protein
MPDSGEDTPGEERVGGGRGPETPRRRFLRGFITSTLWTLCGAALAYPVFSFMTFRKRRKRTVTFTAADQASPVAYREGVYLIRGDHGLHAFSARCTHLGCHFDYEPISRKFRCPCHGSVFDLSGSPVAGPAKKALEQAPISRRENGDILVTLTL